jgi:lipopolysaccharide transport system ATP-binding protein
VEIRGRVASLLEVGTGFHPELTGRENIYLNGAILGMTRREIRSKFDEIVDFAEVEKFLDTPVKRYSSGMYVRLAFSVAAHLEPEILVVDEVLAVGDASFQKKCLGKMEDVTDREGRTVLFVSHQMSAIQALCSTGILLNRGCVHTMAEMPQVISSYLDLGASELGAVDISGLHRSGSGAARFQSVSLIDKNGSECSSLPLGSSIRIRFIINLYGDAAEISVGFSIHDQLGQSLALVYSHYDLQTFCKSSEKGRFSLIASIDALPLAPGKYSIGVRMTQRGSEVDWPKGFACHFSIEDAPYYLNSGGAESMGSLLCIKPSWEVCAELPSKTSF